MATFLERLLIRFTVIRFTECSLYFDIVIFVISHFGFEGGTLDLIASVHSHCLSFTFDIFSG